MGAHRIARWAADRRIHALTLPPAAAVS